MTHFLDLSGCSEDGFEHLELYLVTPPAVLLIQHTEGNLEPREVFDENIEEEQVIAIRDYLLQPQPR